MNKEDKFSITNEQILRYLNQIIDEEDDPAVVMRAKIMRFAIEKRILSKEQRDERD